ncbi:MAG: hypothetical protein JXR69_03225 [Candidatus Delongbacteria bacterium]|nr:hypothetical protein [Candidatus Delongbacteria bacterium]
MTKQLIIFFLIFSTLLLSKQIQGSYTYTYGDNESLVKARQTCKELAIRNAVESFAVYLESRSEIENYQTKKDNIISISLGLVKNIKVTTKIEDKLDNSIYICVEGEINDKEVLKQLNNAHSSPKVTKNKIEKPEWQNYTEQDLGYQKTALLSKNKYKCYKITFDNFGKYASEKAKSGIVYYYDKTNSWKIKQAGIDKMFSSKKQAIKGLYDKLKLIKDAKNFITK